MEYVPFTEVNPQLDLLKELTLLKNYYYVPVDARFPTYDSFTFEQISISDYPGPILDKDSNVLTAETKRKLRKNQVGLFTIFQIIIAKEHDVKESCVAKLLEIAAHNQLEAIALRYIAVFLPYSDSTINLLITWRNKVSMYGLRLSMQE